LNVKLQADDWRLVRDDCENSEEGLEEHGTKDHIAALGLVWVEILSVDLTHLET